MYGLLAMAGATVGKMALFRQIGRAHGDLTSISGVTVVVLFFCRSNYAFFFSIVESILGQEFIESQTIIESHLKYLMVKMDSNESKI